jgi:hypothetical protein
MYHEGVALALPVHVAAASCTLSRLHQGVLHGPLSLVFAAMLYLIAASKPLLLLLLSPTLIAHTHRESNLFSLGHDLIIPSMKRVSLSIPL